ncbi:MAG: HPr family phosphocarrier protein [Myxococcota bacterium]
MSDDDAVVRGRFTIVNEKGMHARAASALVAVASGFPCTISLSGPEEAGVNAKSVMGVLLLCGSKGTVVEVEARGERAKDAVAAIGALIANRFGEDR